MIDSFKKTILSTALLLGATAAAGCDDDVLLLRDDPASEAAYEELTRRWLQWAMALPHSQSPIADLTGEQCALGQDDHVWMLAGTFGGSVTRTCEIPALTPLFFPLMNRWVIPGKDPSWEPADEDELVASVGEYFAWERSHTCSLTLTLDGEPLLADTEELDQELYVALDEPFEVELNADNWASAGGKQGGLYRFALADGHYALLRPLPPGDHVLEFGGETCDDAGTVVWETSAVYELHVAAPGEHAGS